PSEHEPHFNVRKISTQTIPRPEVERLECVLVVTCESWVAKPSFRVESKWVFEVLIVMVHGPLMDSHDRLQQKGSASQALFNAPDLFNSRFQERSSRQYSRRLSAQHAAIPLAPAGTSAAPHLSMLVDRVARLRW